MRPTVDEKRRGQGRGCRVLLRAACAILAAAVVHGSAAGQALPPPPVFAYWKAGDAKVAEWKAMAQLGLATATGNSQAVSLSLQASLSRRLGNNKLAADAGGAFARSQVFVANVPAGSPIAGPGDMHTVDQTTTESWSVRTRYDRFFFDRNALYVQAGASADPPSGVRLLAEGQAGYRRVLLERGKGQLAAELGYDYTHQSYESSATPIQIHSGRAFIGYHKDPNPLLGLDTSCEFLTNLNPEYTPTGMVKALGDDRITGLLGAQVKLFDNGSIGLRFSVHYTTSPAPRPPIPGFSYAPGFVPVADRLDTKSELVLVWNYSYPRAHK